MTSRLHIAIKKKWHLLAMDQVELADNYHTLGVTQRSSSKQMTMMVGLLVGNQNESKCQKPEKPNKVQKNNLWEENMAKGFFFPD